jgi:hypothetical protein
MFRRNMVPPSSGLKCVQRGIGSAVGKDAKKVVTQTHGRGWGNGVRAVLIGTGDRKMEAANVSETSVSSYKTTPCQNPDDSIWTVTAVKKSRFKKWLPLRNPRAVTVFIKSRQWTISWVSWMQFTSLYPPTYACILWDMLLKTVCAVRVSFSPTRVYSSQPPWHNRSNRPNMRQRV